MDLLCYVIRNNHDNPCCSTRCRKIFDKARMGEEGVELIRASKKEAADLMNQGVLLCKPASCRTRSRGCAARATLPNNLRILFNFGADPRLAHAAARLRRGPVGEAYAVLLHVERVQPGQQRFAQLMEQLARLAPRTAEAAGTEAAATEA